jgi:hypothetical protein
MNDETPSDAEVERGWAALQREGGGYFDVGIYKPLDLLAMMVDADDRHWQTIEAVTKVIQQWAIGLGPPCFCCERQADIPHAVVIARPSVDQASVGMGGILCETCGNGTFREVKGRVFSVLREHLMPGLILLHHAPGTA